MEKNKDGKYTPLALVRAFFNVSASELIALGKDHKRDVLELASGIAREHNLPLAELGFEPVPY